MTDLENLKSTQLYIWGRAKDNGAEIAVRILQALTVKAINEEKNLRNNFELSIQETIKNNFNQAYSQIQNNKREQDIAADQIKLLSDALEKVTTQLSSFTNKITQLEEENTSLKQLVHEKCSSDDANHLLGSTSQTCDGEFC